MLQQWWRSEHGPYYFFKTQHVHLKYSSAVCHTYCMIYILNKYKRRTFRFTICWTVKKKYQLWVIIFIYIKKEHSKKNMNLSRRKPAVRCATAPESAPLATKVGSVPVTPSFTPSPCYSSSATSWSPSAPFGLRGRRFRAEPFNVLCAAGEVGVGEVGGVGFSIEVAVGQRGTDC